MRKCKVVIDTNVLLDYPNVIQEFEEIFLPSAVLEELDKLKKDRNLGYKARRASRAIDEATNISYILEENYEMPDGWDKNKNDNKIIMCAKEKGLLIISNDLLVRAKAAALKLNYEGYTKNYDVITSYVEKTLTDEEINQFYAKELTFEEKYVIIKDSMGNIIDTNVKSPTFKSAMLGTVRPLDQYQAIAMDSLINDTFTTLTGKAGTAKTLLSLAYAFQEIEKGRKRKIIIIHNPTCVQGATELGFYKGDAIEKLMQSSIGNILKTKLGGEMMVNQLIKQEVIEAVPMSDCRGMEIPEGSILYVTEAQNLTSEMAKLIIQRAAEDVKVIFDGDYDAQVDSYLYEHNNGLKRVIEVFSKYDLFSHVRLVNIYRSEIANIAEEL